jgi:long-chain acyl-CoA synthetase
MSTRPETLVPVFRDTVAAHADRVALISPGIDGPDHTTTWSEICRDVRQLAVALHHEGVRPGDRIVQVGENSYEWILLDLAVHLVRGVHVALHSVLSGEQIAWQIRDCGAQFVFLSDGKQRAKLGRDDPSMAPDPFLLMSRRGDSISHPYVYSTSDLRYSKALSDPKLVSTADALEAAALADTRPDDLATILYTSGTTGEPKGVMLSHANLISNARGMLSVFPYQPDELRLCWLPLSHIYARTCDLYTWIIGGTQLALAESREKILENCQSLHPTLLNGVPYFFDKVRRHFESLPKATPKRAAHEVGGSSSGAAHEVSGAADGLAELLGGKLRLCSSGGAALPVATAEFYWQHGIRLVQGYGLTESSPVITASHPDSDRMGSVGQPIPGVEVRIGADGEILTRGPHVMLGYWNRPADTADTIRDGWLHTGDLGRLDDASYLWITGRKKDLIVTAAGKNIAPVAIESLLAEEPLISQVVVLGEGRNYLAALIVPDRAALTAEIFERRIPVFTPAQALAHPAVRALYRQRIDQRLACLSENEQIGRFELLDRGLSVEQGELTPTLKLRRATIQEHFAAAIERLYAE